MSLRKASKNNNRLAQLTELRDILAAAIEECDSMRDLAALSRQYRDTVREIAELDNDNANIDEIAQIIEKRKR